MITDKKLLVGWAQALIIVFVLLAWFNVAFRFTAQKIEVNFMICTSFAFLGSALILLGIGGRGKLGKETLFCIDTWVYGVVLFGAYILNMYLFSLVTSTERSLMQRLSMVISIVIGWFILKRTADKWQIIGGFLVLSGVALVLSGFEPILRNTILAIIVGNAALQAIQVLTAELHRPHKKAVQQKDPKAKCRIVGFVMFVIALLFLSIMMVQALFQDVHAEVNTFYEKFPVMHDFRHLPSILYGLFMGIIIVAPIKFLEFSSAAAIKAENFLALYCLSPIATLFWEWSTSPFTGLSLKQLSNSDILAGGLVTLGGLTVAGGAVIVSRNKEQREKLRDHLHPQTLDEEIAEIQRYSRLHIFRRR